MLISYALEVGEMNVNLGTPYESLMQRLIERGYAGNQTEVIRQALLLLEREIEEEEALLVHKAVEIEMAQIRAGKAKTHSFNKVLKEAGLK
jgi:Arc/MetJ-type ribon-helix-helix transcriptional regulator